MILKVRGTNKGNDEWHFYNDLDDPKAAKRLTLSSAQLRHEMGTATHCILAQPPVEGQDAEHFVAIVEAVKRDGAMRRVIFDTEGFLCNDKGDTLEPIRLRR